MSFPRWVWIVVGIVLALVLIVGTVWWLRARALKDLPSLTSASEPPSASQQTSSTRNSRAATSSTIDDAYLDNPVFFVPEVPRLPGIIVESSPSSVVADSSALSAASENVDGDGDGLTDEQERQLGTNIAKTDTDSDGISDKDEVNKYRTDPLRADTDGDTYSDAQEIQNGYNPLGAGTCLTSDCVF